jgi:hypothetical protein
MLLLDTIYITCCKTFLSSFLVYQLLFGLTDARVHMQLSFNALFVYRCPATSQMQRFFSWPHVFPKSPKFCPQIHGDSVHCTLRYSTFPFIPKDCHLLFRPYSEDYLAASTSPILEFSRKHSGICLSPAPLEPLARIRLA